MVNRLVRPRSVTAVNFRSYYYLVYGILHHPLSSCVYRPSHDAPHHLLSDDDSSVYLLSFIYFFHFGCFTEHISFNFTKKNFFSRISSQNKMYWSAFKTNIIVWILHFTTAIFPLLNSFKFLPLVNLLWDYLT